MDKRKVENERVRKSIEEAIFTLMESKSFSEITVSDIVKKAKVARASYYRNFNSKEEIIQSYIKRLCEYIGEEIGYNEENINWLTHYNLTKSLEYYLTQKYYLLLLYKNGWQIANLI